MCAEFHVKVEDVDHHLSILEAELKSLISKNNEAEKLAGKLGRQQAGFQTVLLAAGRGTSNAVLNPTITNLLTPTFVQALSEVSGRRPLPFMVSLSLHAGCQSRRELRWVVYWEQVNWEIP